MERFSKPEIHRVALHSLILQLASIDSMSNTSIINCNNVQNFDFIDPPSSIFIETAYNQLVQKNAINIDGNITKLGKFLASLPLEPSVGIILLCGCLIDHVVMLYYLYYFRLDHVYYFLVHLLLVHHLKAN